MAPNSRDLITFAQYVAPVFTPRDAQGNLDQCHLHDIIPLYVDYLISTGVQGILVGGSAGQGILQSVSERIMVAKAFIAAVKRRIIVIVHTGGVNYQDTVELTDAVSKLDVDCIMLSAPIFFPYFNYSGMVEYLIDAGKACNGKPVLYYHFPSMTNLKYNIVDLAATLKEKMPNFMGLKYTANDVDVYKQLVDLKLKIFLGFPSMTLVGAEIQGSGVSFITGPTNFINGLMMSIVNAVLDGNTTKAKVLQQDLDNFMDAIIVERELMASMTYVMDLAGLPMGQPSKPLTELTDSQKEIVKGNLQRASSQGIMMDLIHRYAS